MKRRELKGQWWRWSCKQTGNTTWNVLVMEESIRCKCTREQGCGGQGEGAPYLGEAEKDGGGDV